MNRSVQLIASLRADVEAAFALLSDARIKQRKDGLKKLGLILDSEDYLRTLDYTTLRIHPNGTSSLQHGVTWPFLTRKFAKYVGSELDLAKEKKKPPDAALSATMKKLVTLAESERRSGRRALLSRDAGRIFAHIASVLECVGLKQSAIAKDYDSILRLFLAEPEYCAAASITDWERVIDTHLDFLQSMERPTADDAHRALLTLKPLLTHAPSELTAKTQGQLVDYFRILGGDLGETYSIPRYGVDAFDAVTAFLMACGRDIASACPALHEMFHKPTLRVLREEKLTKTKDRAVAYVRAQLQLGGVTHDQLGDLQRWASTEARQAQWKQGAHVPAATPLSKSQHSLTLLLAAIHVHSSGILDSDRPLSDTDPNGRPAKRARSTPVLTSLGDAAATNPASGGPVAAALLLEYGLVLPEAQQCEWVEHAAKVLPDALEAGSTQDGRKSGALLWLLRYIHALALDAPPRLASDVTHKSEASWRSIWDALVTSGIRSLEFPTPELETALWILSSIAEKSLFPLLQTSPNSLLSLPVTEWSPTPASVALAACVFRANAHSATRAYDVERNLLQWLGRVEAIGSGLCNVTAAMQAFLRLRVPKPKRESGSIVGDDEPGFQLEHKDAAWVWWIEDGVDERKLGHLTRGLLYMKARARAVAVAAATHRREELEAGAAALTTPAGVQMHEQVAEVLKSAVDEIALEQQGLDLGSTSRVSQARGGATWLALVLNSCETAVRLATSAAIVCRETSSDVPPAWHPEGSLAATVGSALSTAGPLLAEAAQGKEGLTGLEQAALRSLSLALQDHRVSFGATPLSEALETSIPSLEAVFALEGSLSGGGGGGATQAAMPLTALPTAGGGAVAFDDDLDMAPSHVTALPKTQMITGGGTQALVTSAASLPSHFKDRCADILITLAPVFPLAIARCVEKLLAAATAPATPALPSSLHHKLVEAQAISAVAAVQMNFHEAPGIIAKVVGHLDDVSGILSWKILRNVEVECILRQALSLTRALVSVNGLATASEALRRVVGVVHQCMEVAAGMDTTCAVRVLLGSAVATAFAKDSSLFPNEVLGAALDVVSGLAADECYTGRLAGGLLVPIVLDQFQEPSRGFQDIKATLGLSSSLLSPGGAERLETSILMLGETAALVGKLELDSLQELVKEAAHNPPALLLVVATLDWLALTLGYPHRYEYAAWFGPELLHSWFLPSIADAAVGTLDSLVAVRTLVAPTASAAASPQAFVAAVAPCLLGTLVMLSAVDEISRLAEILESTVDNVLYKHLDSVMALTLPGKSSKEVHIREACKAAFASGSLLKQTLGTERLQNAYNYNAISSIGLMLTAAKEPEKDQTDLPLPFFPPETVVEAIRALPGRATPAENDAAVWNTLLKESQVAEILWKVHVHLQRARHPRHAATALGALRAVLLLLDSRVGQPATLRYAVSILLRMLRVRGVRAACCVMLQMVVSHALNGSEDSIAALGSLLPAIVSTLADAVEATDREEADKDISQLVNLLNQLTLNAPQALQPFLPSVDPIPSHLGMEAAAACIAGHRRSIKPAQQLLQFASRAAAMPSTLRRRSIKALRKLLSEQSATLYDDQGRCKPDVGAAGWRLAVLSSDLSDAHLAEFSGEILALLGPLSPGTIAFDASAVLQVEETETSSPAGKKVQETVWPAALRLLCDYLIDERTEVVKAAQSTLRRLLSTQEGQAAQAALDSETRALVGVFAAEARQGTTNRKNDSAAVEDPALWDISSKPYNNWVCDLAYAMLDRADSTLLFSCREMVKAKPAFAELLLPLAFEDLAIHHATDYKASAAASARLGDAITTSMLPHCASQPKAMRLLLKCLNHLRGLHLDARMIGKAQTPVLTHNQARTWPKVYWVRLDYLRLSAAALRCKAYFSALLYCEAWCEEVGRGRLVLPPHTEQRRSDLDALLLEVYSSIDEPDGLYAVSRSNSLLPQLRRFEREGDWAQALATCDLALQLMDERRGDTGAADSGCTDTAGDGLTRSAAQAGILRCLSKLGATSLLGVAAEGWRRAGGIGGDSAATETAAAAAAAGLGQWTPINPGNSESDPNDLHLSAAMAALEGGSAERCGQAVTAARRALVGALATAGLESAGDVNPALIRLQMLQEMCEAWDLRWPQLPNLGSVGSPTKRQRQAGGPAISGHGAVLEENPAFQQALALWKGREAAAGARGRYSLLAPLQNLRRELLRTLGTPSAEVECLLQSAVAARKSGHFNQASGALFRIQRLANSATSGRDGRLEKWARNVLAADAPWRVEESKVLWARGQKDAAIATAQGLLAVRTERSGVDAPLQTLVAKWMAITQSESSTKIMAMLKSAVAATASSRPEGCRTFYRLARYADRLYRGIQDQKSSPEWAMAQSVIQAKKEQLESLKARKKVAMSGPQSNETKRQVLIYDHTMASLIRAIDQDEQESRALQTRAAELLQASLCGYGLCLQAGDKYDLPATFRVVQLWLSLSSDPSVNEAIASIFNVTPSRKLLPLVYQVASRLSVAQTENSFQSTLQRLLVRMGAEHPFHSLLQIMALKNGNRDNQGKRVTDAAECKELAYVADADKVAAAAKVLQGVAASSARAKRIVSELEVATDGYIMLAAKHVAKEQLEMQFPSAFRRQLVTLHSIPVLSVSLPVDPTMKYDYVPYVANVQTRICFPKGINKPKKVDLTDSFGVNRTQLVKSGTDDLRQDAVMQQFFGLLNQFLVDAPATAARDLRIKTYRVVPFSPAAGLLEWVDNTAMLIDFVENNSYSSEGDITAHQALTKMYNAVKDGVPPLADLRHIFDKVTAKLPPVFHRFFLERFREPGAWFQARLAYTRSVAVNSMAGHIIGLGDRHCSNILLDLSSAEVVHIDLGIAFEQGKLLKTPERVPFRLTRNVVDGMGVTGVEGAMRRCSEETLRVLRAQKESLLTVLEVFVHDPLYKWGLTEVQANRRQRADTEAGVGEGEVHDSKAEADGAVGGGGGVENQGGSKLVGNADANRTLLRIKQKLEGIEGGDSAARSVEGQVQHLFTEAMDPDNICRMFYGWQGYL